MLMSIEEAIELKPSEICMVEHQPAWGGGQSWTALYTFSVDWLVEDERTILGVRIKKVGDLPCPSAAAAAEMAEKIGIPLLSSGPFCPF